jgi:glycosyltransferase involved in cell wall biosynthesis
MSGSPAVSVIIPTYYRNDYLEKCLLSVTAQTYEPIEIIVVDDSGEGFAEDVVSQFPDVEYIPLEKNSGPNVARNTGIDYASGEYVQLLDDDDTLRPEKFTRQVQLLEENSQAGVAYCAGQTECGDVFRPDPDARGDVLTQALKLELPSCVTATMLIDAEIMDAVHPLPDPPGSDDTFWKIEFARRTHFDFVNDILVDKNAPEARRGESYDAVQGTWKVLDHYSELYDELDPEVKNSAISRVSAREAEFLLSENLYSLTAIQLFLQAAKTDPKQPSARYLQFLASIFGRPGYYSLKKNMRSIFT